MIAIFLEAIEAVANGIGRSTKYPWIPIDTQKYPRECPLPYPSVMMGIPSIRKVSKILE
jgi:hypothetical protein